MRTNHWSSKERVGAENVHVGGDVLLKLWSISLEAIR